MNADESNTTKGSANSGSTISISTTEVIVIDNTANNNTNNVNFSYDNTSNIYKTNGSSISNPIDHGINVTHRQLMPINEIITRDKPTRNNMTTDEYKFFEANKVLLSAVEIDRYGESRLDNNWSIVVGKVCLEANPTFTEKVVSFADNAIDTRGGPLYGEVLLTKSYYVNGKYAFAIVNQEGNIVALVVMDVPPYNTTNNERHAIVELVATKEGQHNLSEINGRGRRMVPYLLYLGAITAGFLSGSYVSNDKCVTLLLYTEHDNPDDPKDNSTELYSKLGFEKVRDDDKITGSYS